jgi:hypothetical protein
MPIRRSILVVIFSLVVVRIVPACANPDLSGRVPDFRASQVSRVEALLRFGDANNLCFGIEYVDSSLLRDRVEINVQSGTVEDAVKSIMDGSNRVSIKVVDGVVEVGPLISNPSKTKIFDHVLPVFQSKRGSLQEISNLLHMDLVVDLDPDITGFAGHYPSGDRKDQVGPFLENKRSVRYLLDALLVQSKARAWISRVDWRHLGNIDALRSRPVWTFVEPGTHGVSDYSSELASIATAVESSVSPN